MWEQTRAQPFSELRFSAVISANILNSERMIVERWVALIQPWKSDSFHIWWLMAMIWDCVWRSVSFVGVPKKCLSSVTPGAKVSPSWGLIGVQRWFRNYQCWPALFQVWFSAVHNLKISEQRWKINFSKQRNQRWAALFQRWTALIFSETVLNSADFSQIQDDIYQFSFQFVSEKFRCNWNSRNRIPIFSQYCWETIYCWETNTKIKKYLFNLLTSQRYNLSSTFWIFWSYSSEEINTMQNFKSIFPYSL